MPIPYDFYRISHSDIGNETYFATKAYAEMWLRSNGYVLADPKIWDHVWTDDNGKSHTFLTGETFEETFDDYEPTWKDKLDMALSGFLERIFLKCHKMD